MKSQTEPFKRLDNFRKTGETGWQYANPFPEITKFVIEQKKSGGLPLVVYVKK